MPGLCLDLAPKLNRQCEKSMAPEISSDQRAARSPTGATLFYYCSSEESLSVQPIVGVKIASQ